MAVERQASTGLSLVNKQWGENVGGGGQTVSLPISFEVAFTAVVSADSSWCNASCHITTTTITTMNYQSNRPDIAQAGPVQWLAIGIQPQWGTAGGSATFAVPFTNVLNIVCASNNSENINCQVTSINNNGFSTNRSYQCKWLAIGI